MLHPNRPSTLHAALALQTTSLEKQLELSELEIARLKENAAAAAARMSACQEELAAAKRDAFHRQQALEAAKQDISQVRS